MNTLERQNLLGILKQKKEWLEKMLKVTIEFEKQLLSDDIDAFVEGLQSREDMIGRIDAFVRMEREMPCKNDPEIESLKQRTRTIIREILKIDQKNAALAAKKIEDYKEQIKNINQQKKSAGYAKAYGNSNAVYFDKKN